MRRIAGILLLLWLGGASASAASCSLARLAQFDTGKGPSVFIPIGINGKDVPFLVDTGGAVSMVAPSVLAERGVTIRKITSGTELYFADGTVADHWAGIDKLTIGPVTVPDARLVVMPSDPKTGTDRLQGILAPDLLQNFDLDFAFGQHRFSLFSPKHCPGQVVYWATRFGTVPFTLDNGHIFADVTLDGHHYRALIDTGATRTVLAASLAARDFNMGAGAPGVKAVEGAKPGALVRDYAQFHTLTIGDVAVEAPEIGLIDESQQQRSFRARHDDKDETDPVYGVQLHLTEMVLGLDVLSKLHLYVAYGEHTLYVTAADAAN